MDNYNGGLIPSCQLQVKWNKDQPPVAPRDDLHKKVVLRGAKKPFNHIAIQSDPIPSGMSVSSAGSLLRGWIKATDRAIYVYMPALNYSILIWHCNQGNICGLCVLRGYHLSK